MICAKRNSWHNLLPALAAVALLAGAAGNAGAAGDGIDGLTPGSPAEGIYGRNHLAGLPDKAEIVFDYRFEGSIMEEPFADDVLLDFTRNDDSSSSGYSVEMTLFSKTRNQTVGPVSAAAVNPILLIFFQRDVTHMSNGTGGSQHYFRNAIRTALQQPDESAINAITIDLGGRQVAASEISLRPFSGDSHRAQMRNFADKTYRFVVSAAVPGGIYEVQSETPDDTGEKVLLRETYRFREIR